LARKRPPASLPRRLRLLHCLLTWLCAEHQSETGRLDLFAGAPRLLKGLEFLRNVGTFDPGAFNEVRPNVVTANGAAGFNVPSLLSVVAGAPYLHSGSAQTLDEVLNNVTHRSAGTGGVDTLSNSADRQALVGFLKSIDEQTPPFP